MLQHLVYSKFNLLIDSLSLNFNSGFTTITGETGSGKSILLGAIQLLLGDRADNSALLDKSKKCVIEGTFDIKNLDLKNFFVNNDLDYDDILIIRREIYSSTRSRAFINDTPVNLNILKNLGEQLINIHSQFDTLLLGTQKFQYALLDSFAKTHDLLILIINYLVLILVLNERLSWIKILLDNLCSRMITNISSGKS